MNFFHTHSKPIVAFLMIIIVNQVAFPTVASALTSGPAQPEMQGFTPVGTTDMVDVFTGDFSYNIPLLDVGGYPLNLSYQSGITPDAEASWVGLGWTFNPGVINRDMRGMPDDFKGDAITQSSNMKDDVTVGVNLGPGVEVFGFFGASASGGIYWNSYRGYGITAGISPSISVGLSSKGQLTAGLGLNFDTGTGLDVTANVGLRMISKLNELKTLGFGMGVSGGVNSRRGLKDLTISSNMSASAQGKYSQSQRLFNGAISFGSSTYFPTSPLPLRNISFSFHGTLGGEAFGINPNGTLNGYYSRQYLEAKTQQQNAYGVLYAADATTSDLMDFNREQQGAYRDVTPNMPIGYATYDMFSATGQGAGGQFRATRNDIGSVHDGLNHNLSQSGNYGVEIGLVPNLVHGGGDINVASTESRGEMWVKDNEFLGISNFTATDNSLYEPVYFKNTGELTISDKGFYENVGNTKSAYVNIKKSGSTVLAKSDTLKLESTQRKAGFKLLPGSTIKRTNREKRNQVFSYLNAKEAEKFGLEKRIYFYTQNTQNMLPRFSGSSCNNPSLFGTRDSIDRTGSVNFRKEHHISEITATTPDGSRYVYGIPAYNTLQKEVSFSVENLASTDGLVTYTSTGANPDNSTLNKKGKDNYYDAQIIPPYAHSYLLTGVLSADYVDVAGDGITDDDLGNAVKLNYTKRSADYKWRTPYGTDGAGNQANKARFQKGNYSDPKDDKANYVYGTKEIWYLHSVESKTMVAQIYLSDRLDGKAVVGENGTRDGVAGNSLQKIDSIALFSKSDIAACSSGQTPVPIKVVHFEYDYSLCGNVPNNSGVSQTIPPSLVNINANKGKLTLKKVWFSYGKNRRGKFNAYKFGYNAATNPVYSNAFVDRWGSYKMNPAGYPTESEFSFALQNKTDADNYARSWNLDTVHIPSGGKIVAKYEADDYAYVQDKRAGQMVFIKGFGTGANSTSFSDLYTGSGPTYPPYQYVYFDVPSGIVTDILDTTSFKTKYLNDIGKIYFNCLAKVTNPGSSTPLENINGFMEYDKSKRRCCMKKLDIAML